MAPRVRATKDETVEKTSSLTSEASSRMRTLAVLPTLKSRLWGTAKIELPLGSLSENRWPRALRILMPKAAAKLPARSMRIEARRLLREMITML